MAPWKHTINIKQFLGDEGNSAAVIKAADGILSQLGDNLPAQWDLVHVKDHIQYAKDLAEANDPDALEEFNGALDCLYDYGDEHRIWMGAL